MSIASFKYQRSKYYWLLSYYFDLCTFYFNRFIFNKKSNIKDVKESFSISKELLSHIKYSVLFTLILFVVFKFIDLAVIKLSVVGIDLPFFQRFFEHYADLTKSISSNSYLFTNFIATVASISGVFLALYFTAISVVASSAYLKVPSELRNELLREKAGVHYIRTLALLTSLSLVLLGYISIGKNPGLTNYVVIAILALYGIYCFVQLGFRIFDFIDPTALSVFIFRNLYRDVRLATIYGYRYHDPAFQVHYQKSAVRHIETLYALMQLCRKEEQLKKGSLGNIIFNLFEFLIYYEDQRSCIPSDSKWYRTTPKYHNWFLQDHSKLSIALETRTGIPPELIPNPNWLEDDVFDVLCIHLRESLDEENYDVAHQILKSACKYLQHLGSHLEFENGHNVINKLRSICEVYFDSKEITSFRSDKANNLLVVFEYYSMMAISLILGGYTFIRDTSRKKLALETDTLNWKDEKNIYKNHFVPPLIPRIDYIRNGLIFERRAERCFKSPPWYLTQLIVARYLELFFDITKRQIDMLKQFYVERSDSHLLNQNYILASYHSHKGLEYCNKISYHSTTLKKLTEELDTTRINKELPWPTWDWDGMQSEIEVLSRRLVINISKCLPALSNFSTDKDENPDIFGQAYNTVCFECYSAIEENNGEYFKQLFPFLFAGSLIAYDILRIKCKDMSPEMAYLPITEPLIDILELSGYAMIYSELFNAPDIWNECKDTWQKYLSQNNNPADVIKLLINVCECRIGSLKTTHRDLLRTNWKIGLNRHLYKMQLIDGLSGRHYGRAPDVQHPSPLIRALCDGRMEPHESATEAFIVNYLLTLQEAQGLEFTDRWDLAQTIDEKRSEIEMNDENES